MTDAEAARQAGRALDYLDDSPALRLYAKKGDIAELPRRWLAVPLPPGEWVENMASWECSIRAAGDHAAKRAPFCSDPADRVRDEQWAAVYHWLSSLLQQALDAHKGGGMGE